MQFKYRLSTNAFDLTENALGHTIGFSGTKDTSKLLPFQVTQRAPEDASVASTDGLMLHLVSQRNQEVISLGTYASQRDILKLVVQERGADAFIDAGALMAGMDNREVATHIMSLLSCGNAHLQGVVYFSVPDDTWYVLSRNGRTLPRGSSPIRERDAFVYFDESRCRGADMKLRETAVACLTVGPGMGKEKVMQAAYRMRQLKSNQKVIFIVAAELLSNVKELNQLDQSDDLRSEHILQWTTYNSVLAVRDGLVQWGSQAIHYITTQRHPETRRIDEALELKELYGSTISPTTVWEVMKEQSGHAVRRINSLDCELDETSSREMKLALEHVKRYGSDVRITASGMDEECERQLESERELEREIELQVPRQAPASQIPWDFSTLLRATHPEELPDDARVTPLADAMAVNLAAKTMPIDWASCGIFVTQNFVETIVGCQQDNGTEPDDLSQYLRPIDVVFLFCPKTCLLLSEWEADHVLELMQADTAPHLRGHGGFVNIAYLLEAVDCGYPSAPLLQIPSSQVSASELMVAGLQLLAGDTMFKTTARKQAVRELLSTKEAKESALLLPEYRGRRHEISHSDLEAICCPNIVAEEM